MTDKVYFNCEQVKCQVKNQKNVIIIKKQSKYVIYSGLFKKILPYMDGI